MTKLQKILLVVIGIFTISLIIYTYQNKKQSFYTLPISGKSPLTVVTSNLDACKFYKIDWGDGTTSNSYNAQKTCEYEEELIETEKHTYVSPGKYTISAYYGTILIGNTVTEVVE